MGMSMSGTGNLFRGVLFGLVLGASNLQAKDGLHIFTDRQDRVVSARIVRVDERRGLVELELENKRRTKVKPSIFIEKDQAYIRDWQSLQAFNASSSFKVELNKKVIEDWTEKGTAQRDFERIIYEIEMTNRDGGTMAGLLVEYNVFYEQEQLGSTDQYTEKHCTKGRVENVQIAGRSCKTLTTDPLVIFDQHLSGGYDGYVGGLPERQEGDIKGVWVKVSMSTPSGASATREFLSPNSLKSHQVWQAPPEISSEKSSPEKKKKSKKKKRL